MYCHAQTLAASRYQTMSISSGTFCGETQLNASHLHALPVMGEKKKTQGEKNTTRNSKKKKERKKTAHTFQKSIKVTVFICVHEVISCWTKFGASKCLLRRRERNPSRSPTLRHSSRIAITPNSPDFNCAEAGSSTEDIYASLQKTNHELNPQACFYPLVKASLISIWQNNLWQLSFDTARHKFISPGVFLRLPVM